ncbi:kinase-like protein [Myriangium duriaei CBS 260.36]|uniref:Kinase-like protein n=1 Tax=Myriangium duriaei CBS 260.36 TaxID=1168546 RepID=A0A9P4MHL6_9PEZI|nr:kinase-like protein [Myriangium duriaei CBS 260.36]
MDCSNSHCILHLGDVLNHRYKIFRKLGSGSQATIWLAKDLVAGGYVAVKVHTTKDDPRVLQVTHHPNVEFLLDRFLIESAKGKHLCTVLEPLGRSLRDTIDEWLFNKPRSCEREYRRPPSVDENDRFQPHKWSLNMTREICRQVLAGIDSLHSKGIAHRDIHPGNVAFALSYAIDSRTIDEIQQDGAWSVKWKGMPVGYDDWDAKNLELCEHDIFWNRPVNGKLLKPKEVKYSVCEAPLHDRLVFDELPPFRAVLIDLGFSLPFEECNEKLVGPSNYRAPEAILPIPVTYKADIFTTGIMFYEVVISRNIVWSHWNRHKHDDDRSTLDNNKYLKDLETKLGPMPKHFENIVPPPSLYNWNDEPVDEGDLDYGDMRLAARRDGPEDMTDIELEAFVDLISQMMQWEPEKRPDTKKLLEHPFFYTAPK